MKEIQIPRKNFGRSYDPGTKRFKDSELKNRKVSGAISDSEAESIMQGPSLDLLSTPEICLLSDESPVSTIISMEDHIDASSTDRIQSIADFPAAVQSLRSEINELKKTDLFS